MERLRLKSLTPQQAEDLRAFMRACKDARLLKRAQIVWLSHQGLPVEEIARLLDISPDTVREWIRRYEERGLDGLRDEERPGRPLLATPLYVSTLLAWVPRSPEKAGYPVQGWTAWLLRDHLERVTGIRISDERVRQLLVEHGFRHSRPKLWLWSPDPEYEKKVARIRKMLEEVPDSTVVLFEDETEVHLNPRVQACWQRGQRKVRAAGRDAKLHLFGAVNFGSLRVHRRLCKRQRSVEFLGLLRQLLRAYPGKNVILVLDNYGIHWSRRVRKFLESGEGRRVALVFLPTYSPNLNIIEPFWKFVKAKVASNRFHGSIERLRGAVNRFFRGYERGKIPAFRFPTGIWKNFVGAT